MPFPFIEWGWTKLRASPLAWESSWAFYLHRYHMVCRSLSMTFLCPVFVIFCPVHLHGSEDRLTLGKKWQRVPLPRKQDLHHRQPGILCYQSIQASNLHVISVHLFCSLITSCPVFLFLSSYNRWFLSYFSCILKSSWVPRCILNISPSHFWVFLNVFFFVSACLRGIQILLNPVADWGIDYHGCTVGRNVGGQKEKQLQVKGLQVCLLICRSGQCIPSKFFLYYFFFILKPFYLIFYTTFVPESCTIILFKEPQFASKWWGRKKDAL